MTGEARYVFAVLVLATFGAFFVTQKLKSQPRVVRTLSQTTLFSPNGDKRRENATIRFKLESRSDDVTVRIQEDDGDDVRTLIRDRDVKSKRVVRLQWDGRDSDSKRVADGEYRVRINLRRSGRSALLVKKIRVDTIAPRPVVQVIGFQPRGGRAAEVDPERSTGPVILAPGGGTVSFRYLGFPDPVRRAPRFVVYRTDVKPPVIVARLVGTRGSRVATWDATVGGRPAPEGVYAIAARIRDRASNTGTSPPLRPGVRDTPVSKPGVTIRGLAVQPPSVPVVSGRRARFFVDARGQSYQWRVRRVGAPHALADWRTVRGPVLRVYTPQNRSGVYLMQVRTRTRFAQVPFAVQNPERKRRILLVLPTISWQGTNPVDDDGNGLPNVLEELGLPNSPRVDDTRVRVDRVYADDGLPRGFRTHEAPLLAFLDRARLRYDVTTDFALQRAVNRDVLDELLAGYRGIVFAGNAIWETPSIRRRVLERVRAGGRVLVIGTEGLRRGTFLRDGFAFNPAKETPRDFFGIQPAPPRREPTDLLVYPGDEVALFTTSDGLFASIENSRAIASSGQEATVVAGAGGEDGRPVVAALSFGKGLVIRTGIPEWSRRLDEDSNTQAVTARAWTILER